MTDTRSSPGTDELWRAFNEAHDAVSGTEPGKARRAGFDAVLGMLGVAQAEPNRVALIGVNRLLNKISNLIDDEDTCDPLDDAIKWANEALAITGTLALPSTTRGSP